MYSGSDSADSQKYSQWPINAPGYQNSSSDHVDWAALAQQWIIMKEAGPPPIPGGQLVNIQKEVDGRKKDLNEGGEAPMDVENEKEEQTTWNAPGNSVTVDGIAPPPPPPPGTETWNAWNSTGNANWNWSNTWNSPSVVPPPVKPPLLPTPEAFSGPPDSASDNAVPFRAPGSNNFSPGFWTGMGVGKVTQTEIKPHNKRYSKVNVPTKVTIITPPVSNTSTVTSVTEAIAVPVAAPVTTPTIDANKRKQLPAWIREGLEKMEKDKQKQLEKEREKHAREEFTEKIKQEEKEKMEILKREVMQRSKFDSDNERSDSEETVKRKSPTMQSVPLTAEELMTKVRKAMTEILLKVTNQQIAEICQEERQRYLKKKRASDHLASAPSGAILSAKLGLGVYNDDDDDSNSSRDTDGDSQRNDDDSDLELKESILRRQTEFSKTERQIELRLAEAQGKKIRDKSVSSGSESDDHSQTDTRADSASWRNASDSEKRRAGGSTSSSGSSNYLNSKCRSRRRSSSSDSSGRRDKSRSESSERSRRADRRRRSRSRSSKRSNKRRRSSSDSPYSRRSQRSRSRSKSSYSSRRSTKMSRRSSRSRSRPRDRKRSSHRSRRSKSRSRSYRGSFRRSVSSPRRNHSSSRRDRSRSRRRRSSRSSSRGKRSHRR
ncbi:uncharacterized protein LOC143193579 isoform X2 [Rhynchophorus ferrugineus]|uniref:Arginine/serine-rich protein PNISR n=1 Tax=Rhynchophorus ferrugineus TaxID=354439 RepID=A0A834HVL8_RHYFE|nr:hypothetical protein GWI33_018681 [Rhynchophorus ferrugineus]